MALGQVRGVVGCSVAQRRPRVRSDPALEQRACDEGVAEGAVPAAAAGAEGADAGGQGAGVGRGGCAACVLGGRKVFGAAVRQCIQVRALFAPLGRADAHQPRAVWLQPEQGRGRRHCGAAQLQLGRARPDLRFFDRPEAAGGTAADRSLAPLQRQQRLLAKAAGDGLAGGTKHGTASLREAARCGHGDNAEMPVPHHSSADPLTGLAVFERGWLSSNNLLVHAAPGEAGALLVDTGHVNHAAQTLALVRRALAARADRALARIVNTHLHSDHCGGNAALQQAFGAPLAVPAGQADAVRCWDEAALSYRATGQRIARFAAQQRLAPGEPLVAGGREWQWLAAPGHDPHSMMLFDAAQGVLVSADALWENGFGVVFPELEGEPGFDDVAAVLDTIARLPVRLVIPGHGAPFADVAGALARARARLAGLQADPARHARHGAKVLIKYHLMEERAMAFAELSAWAIATPLFGQVWQRFAPRGVVTPAAWVEQLVADLVNSGALALRDGKVFDA